MTKHEPVPVVDLFAGPGGLGEGFSSVGRSKGTSAFHICLSVEKNSDAHRTLRIRSFFRQFPHGSAPDQYYAMLRGELSENALFEKFPEEARRAESEAWLAELGAVPHEEVKCRIQRALAESSIWVLIGGPPCQAYSIAGRSRNKGNKRYGRKKGKLNRLYIEYLKIITDFWPPLFVMENVAGLLSSTFQNERMFERIFADLQSPFDAIARTANIGGGHRRHAYRVFSLVKHPEMSDEMKPSEFLVRAEQFGVPQARHRVILLGIREDVEVTPRLLRASDIVPVSEVLNGLPRVRSRLSREPDSPNAWHNRLIAALKSDWLDGVRKVAGEEVWNLMVSALTRLRKPKHGFGAEFIPYKAKVRYRQRWFLDQRLGGVCNHIARAHMVEDLYRYLYASCFAQVHGRTPKLQNFPEKLLPDHKNVFHALNGGFFNDRFRVQVYKQPAATITSHLSKDGHYCIHPDPTQCRSLTVREAARLQTFPDNYFFAGPRTAQYVQVGNAVPPLLAREIAEIVLDVLERAELVD